MSIALKTHKMLWGRSGNRCAMSDCRIELVMDITETDNESLVGEECHIVARSSEGPRGDSDFGDEQINKYDNLILLCRNHHKIIDDHPEVYTIEKLKKIKKDHEVWVKSQLSFDDSQKLKDDELYASYIDTWMQLAHIESWDSWCSFLLAGDDPKMLKTIYDDLEELKKWLFNRIWPGSNKKLEDALENFRLILEDLLMLFMKHMKPTDDIYYTEKFYKLIWHDRQEDYDRLFNQFMFHVILIEDLVFELTRAANYIFRVVREHIESSFRSKEGILTVTVGPFMDMTTRTYRLNYKENEIDRSMPYLNLNTFLEERITRDTCRGVGISPDDQRFIKYLNEY